MKFKLLTLAALSLLSASAFASNNNGFEDGNLNGYSTVGSVSVMSSFNGLSAAEGQYFAILNSSSGVSMSDFGGTDGSILSRHVNLAAGETFSFKWAFSSADYMPYNDFSMFIGTQQVTLRDVSQGSSAGWSTFNWTPTQAFNGDVKWLVANRVDGAVPSYLLVDAVSAAPVPEPETYAMMLAGLGLMGVFAKRRKAA